MGRVDPGFSEKWTDGEKKKHESYGTWLRRLRAVCPVDNLGQPQFDIFIRQL